MRKREAISNRVLLAVVLVIGVVVVIKSAQESEYYNARLTTSYREVTTVRTQVRLLESRDPPPSPVKRTFSSFVPPTSLQCVDGPPANPESLAQHGIVADALAARAKIAGFHNKSGVLSPEQWRPEYRKKRNVDMSVWFSIPHKKHSGCMSPQPPLHYPGCTVIINHHYKFIWIKGKRVGGTASREPLGWICEDDWLMPEGASLKYCSEQLHENEEVSLEAVREYWDTYFVFSFVRNPYARFASGYSYVRGLMGDCPRIVNFGKICDSPFLMAKMCSILSCCWAGAVSHHLSHGMGQHVCLFTDTGQVAVDFIGEMENLSSDLQIVLDEINRRKSADLPLLMIKGASLPYINSQGDQYAPELFRTNPSCLDKIERNYWGDFDRLGYNRITTSI